LAGPERHDALEDALAPRWAVSERMVRGGSGTGNAIGDLQQAFNDVVSLDLSHEMLRPAAVRGHKIQSDASALPFRTGSASIVALINMFLFPAEISRVLGDAGVLCC
jgi:ubiquinone/menaquinone biosynthesis C-methylase UbiE